MRQYAANSRGKMQGERWELAGRAALLCHGCGRITARSKLGIQSLTIILFLKLCQGQMVVTGWQGQSVTICYSDFLQVNTLI